MVSLQLCLPRRRLQGQPLSVNNPLSDFGNTTRAGCWGGQLGILPSNPAVTLRWYRRWEADTPNSPPSHPTASRYDHLILVRGSCLLQSKLVSITYRASLIRFRNVSLSTITVDGICQLTRACALSGRTGGWCATNLMS